MAMVFALLFGLLAAGVQSAEYEVEVLTSNKDYAGTGSPIYYTFVGTKASTPEFLAPGDRYRGRTDVLRFEDKTDIGAFKCLNVRIGGKDGWHIQEINVKIDGVLQGTIVNKIGWMDNYMSEPFCLQTLYTVTILTSDIKDAGSDSAFYYTFVGTEGKTQEYKANNVGNDRFRGRSDTWKISDDTDIGSFTCLHIRMEGRDGWHFKSIDISINSDALPTIQNTYGWLDDDIDTDFCLPDPEPVVDPIPKWQCHKYTQWDNKWASRNSKTEEEKCERLEGRKFTKGTMLIIWAVKSAGVANRCKLL